MHIRASKLSASLSALKNLCLKEQDQVLQVVNKVAFEIVRVAFSLCLAGLLAKRAL